MLSICSGSPAAPAGVIDEAYRFAIASRTGNRLAETALPLRIHATLGP